MSTIDTEEDINLAPCNMRRLFKGNQYRNINICIKYAREIELSRFEDLSNKLSEWISYVNEFESEDSNNTTAQSEIAKYYENLKKPELIALKAFEESRLIVEEYKDDESTTPYQTRLD